MASRIESETTRTTTTTTTPAQPVAELPCEPTINSLGSITYCICGSQYYVQAYGDAGLVYVPVQAPH